MRPFRRINGILLKKQPILRDGPYGPPQDNGGRMQRRQAGQQKTGDRMTAPASKTSNIRNLPRLDTQLLAQLVELFQRGVLDLQVA